MIVGAVSKLPAGKYSTDSISAFVAREIGDTSELFTTSASKRIGKTLDTYGGAFAVRLGRGRWSINEPKVAPAPAPSTEPPTIVVALLEQVRYLNLKMDMIMSELGVQMNAATR